MCVLSCSCYCPLADHMHPPSSSVYFDDGTTATATSLSWPFYVKHLVLSHLLPITLCADKLKAGPTTASDVHVSGTESAADAST